MRWAWYFSSAASSLERLSVPPLTLCAPFLCPFYTRVHKHLYTATRCNILTPSFAPYKVTVMEKTNGSNLRQLRSINFNYPEEHGLLRHRCSALQCPRQRTHASLPQMCHPVRWQVPKACGECCNRCPPGALQSLEGTDKKVSF